MHFRFFDRKLLGTGLNDSLSGGTEDDLICGLDGNDVLVGNDGNDTLSGGAGNDRLSGRNGNDSLLAGAGDDHVDGGANDDRLFGEAGADTLIGGLGDDVLRGGTGNDSLDGGRNDDSLAGNEGADTLRGGTGNDALWGGAENDLLDGGDGNDFLAGGFGVDRLIGGRGKDVFLMRSDAGEPEIAQDPDAALMTSDHLSGDDTLTGGLGADLFRWELVVNAPDEVVEAHANANGWIDWGGVTGENGGVHDHWVDSIGTDRITDFNWAEGDRIEIAGHTVHAHVEIDDCDGDGAVDDTCIHIYSDQGANGGAHHLDELGHIHVLNTILTDAQISVDHHRTYGAYDRLGEGPHRFEDAGQWTNDSDDWWFFQDKPGVSKTGTDAAEALNGSVDDDTLNGGAGADTLRGNNGDDILDGGTEADSLAGQNGDDLLIGGAGNDSLDGGADQDKLSGGTGRDTLIGGLGDDQLFGGTEADSLNGGRNDDSLAGNAGDDQLLGDTGDDALWGGEGNDRLDGGDGNDFLAGGFGSDRLIGGRGKDVFLMRSDAGEPEIAQDPDAALMTNDHLVGNDTITGGAGADLFRWELVVNAPDEVAEGHANNEGRVDWGGVTGENGGIHDHWVDAIGTDVITDFNYGHGDRIEIVGHTVHAHVEIDDCDGDGAVDDSCIHVYSDQGANGGAHHMDELGHIHVLNNILSDEQIGEDHHRTYGAYDYLGEGPHRFEDAGLWTDNNRDWGLLLPA